MYSMLKFLVVIDYIFTNVRNYNLKYVVDDNDDTGNNSNKKKTRQSSVNDSVVNDAIEEITNNDYEEKTPMKQVVPTPFEYSSFIKEVTDNNNIIIVSQKTFNRVKEFQSNNVLLKHLRVVNNYKLQTSYESVIAKLNYVDFSVALEKLQSSGKKVVRNQLGKYISVNYEESTLTIDHKSYNFRKYTIVNCQSSENSNNSITKLVESKKLVAAALHMVCRFTKVYELDKLVRLLTATVLQDVLEQTVTQGGEVYGRELGTAQSIIEAHKISAIGIYKEERRFKFTNTEFQGEEFDKVSQFFHLIGEPTFSDKNNKSYIVFGDGCRAAGVDLVGSKIVTINPTDASKAAKILNRMSSHFFLYAPKAALIVGDTGYPRSNSNLQFALSDNKTVQHSGIKVPVFVSFGGFNLANGIAETNAAKDVRFGLCVPKSLTNSVSLTRFGELDCTYEELCEKVKQHLSTVKKVEAHSAIEYEGVPILVNRKHFPIFISSVKAVYLSAFSKFSKAPRSLIVEVQGFSSVVKKSPKLRALTKKMTAFPTNTVIRNSDGVEVDWTMILNRECIKGSSAIIDIFANEFPNSTVVWNKGVLTIDDTEWTQKDLMKWFNDRLQSYTVERVVDASVITELGLNEYEQEVLGNNLVLVKEKVQGFFGESTCEVEVSTADENHGASKLGTNEQYILSFAGESVSNKLLKLSNKCLQNADLLSWNGVLPTVDALDKSRVGEVFPIYKSFGTKAYFSELMRKHKHGVTVQFNDNGGKLWSINLRFDLFSKFGSFDEAGYPVDVNTSDEDDNATANLMQDVFDFINVLHTADDESVLKDWFSHLCLVNHWTTELVTAKRAARLVKAGNAHHQKVVGDLTCGYHRGLPIVKIGADNPLLKDNSTDSPYCNSQARFTNNEIVFLSRCPLPLYTACVIQVVEELDSTVVAVNPLVWIKSNTGDFDGDLAYLVGGKAYGYNRYGDAVEFNKTYSAIAHHNNVFSKDVYDGAGECPVADVIWNHKSTDELLKDWTAVNNSIEIEELAELARRVHQHYRTVVGSLYNNADSLTQYIGEKHFLKQSVKSEEIRALILAWYYYEQFGLGGYSAANDEKVQVLNEAVAKETDKLQITSDVYASWGVTRIMPVTTNSCKSACEFYPHTAYLEAAKRVAKGRDILQGKLNGANNSAACLTMAIRILTRKSFNKREDVVFKALKASNVTSRFGKHIEVIGGLRCNARYSK